VKAIGIDWGHSELCIAVVDDVRSRPTCTYLSAHDLPALLALIEQQAEGGPILIAIEAGKRLIADSLRAHGFEVTEVAPERADIARKAYFPGGAKDDRRDAKALAFAVLEAPRLLGQLVPFPPRRRQLRQLSQARTRAVHCRVRAIQQLIDITRNGHPGLDALGLDFTTNYALALAAAYPNPLLAHRARRSKIARLIKRAKSLDAERVLACFADRGHAIDPLVADAVAEEISMTVERIQLMTRHIRRYDKLIATAFADHPDAEIFASIPGMGPALAPSPLGPQGGRDAPHRLRYGTAPGADCHGPSQHGDERLGARICPAPSRRALQRTTLLLHGIASARQQVGQDPLRPTRQSTDLRRERPRQASPGRRRALGRRHRARGLKNTCQVFRSPSPGTIQDRDPTSFRSALERAPGPGSYPGVGGLA